MADGAWCGVWVMTKAIEHIVAGYSTLKNRKALEEIRDHRRRLLNDYRMRSGSGMNFDWINAELQEEIGVVEEALSKLGDEQQPLS
jgi:hypothetical protein